jgi:hypothetical protein
MGHLRASPAVVVKITTEKVSISTLATHFLKNTPTILFILLFILFKYYFLIFILLFYFLPFSLPSPSPTPIATEPT